jgi:hypothetical protein
VLLRFFAVAAALLASSAIWSHLLGRTDLVSLFLGLGGIMITAATLKAGDVVTAFEQRQLDALSEISYLLRERHFS